MANRRELLHFGLAATVLPFAASQVLAATGAQTLASDSIQPYKVVVDTRFPASVAFGQRAEQQGLPLAAIAGDVTRFWYDDLYHRWKQSPAAIAGLTGYGALFCLEQLAWDQRMRVVFRAEHSAASAGCLRHAIAAPDAVIARAEDAARAANWPVAMAEVVAQCPANRGSHAAVVALGVSTAAFAAPAEPLFSWLIAPRART